jgi:hypothetical protein
MAHGEEEFRSFVLEIEAERYRGYLDDPVFYVHDIKGKIVVEDETGTTIDEAGTFGVTYVDADGAAAQRIAAFDVFDSYQTTYDYFATLYEDMDFAPKVRKLVEPDTWYWSSNLLILDRLIIHPKYRGNRLGLEILVMLMQRFQAGAQLVAMNPYPLQFEHDVTAENKAERGLADFTCSKDYATRRLRRYYAKIGFRRVAGTTYMIRPTSTPLSA